MLQREQKAVSRASHRLIWTAHAGYRKQISHNEKRGRCDDEALPCTPYRLLPVPYGCSLPRTALNATRRWSISSKATTIRSRTLQAHKSQPGWCRLLEDGDLRLTESSAILKYLGDKYDLPAYPKDLKKRAKINEAMDWLNTQLYRDFGYGLVYPQLFPHHKRRSDEAHAGAVAWGQQGAKNWLQIFNDHWIGPKNQYLCNNELSIADYFGAGVVSIGELIDIDFSAYPNIKRWLENMKKLKSWNQVNEVFNGFVAANKGKKFVHA